LITEKLISRTLTFPDLRTYRARVRCTSRNPSRRPCVYVSAYHGVLFWRDVAF